MKKRNLILILYFIIPFKLFSQFNGQIIDNSNGETIQYANIWIENEDFGTTSDQNGKFSFNQNITGKYLIVSAVGFERKKILIENEFETVKLVPRIYEIDEVIVKPSDETDKLVIGQFNESKINYYYACSDKPWIVAKLIKYEERFENKTFINNLKLLSQSDIKSCTFSLRFIEVNDSGFPGNELLNKLVLVKAKKGKNVINVNLSEYYLEIPKNGLLIAVEWLIIDQNKKEFEYEYFSNGILKKEKRYVYEPSIGSVPIENNETCWIYDKGNWRKVEKIPESIPLKEYIGKYAELAFELTLSN